MDSQQPLLVNKGKGRQILAIEKPKESANLDHSDASENSSDLVNGHLGFDLGRLLKILVVVVTTHSPGGRRLVVVATTDSDLVKEMIKFHDIAMAGTKSRNGYDAFHIVAKQGNFEVLKVLMDAIPELPRACDSLNNMALHTAAL